jgi:predicted PurR-regulated permease PerM
MRLICAPFVKNLPTAFQKNALWTAVTALSITVLGALLIGLIYLVTKVIAFLQPILIPFAVAGVLAYLLEPMVAWLEQRKMSRQRAVLIVFAAFTLLIGGLVAWVGPQLTDQTAAVVKRVPGYAQKARAAISQFATDIEAKTGFTLLPQVIEPEGEEGAEEPVADLELEPLQPQEGVEGTDNDAFSDLDLQAFLSGEWVKTTFPTLATNTFNVIKSSVGGFLGVFGFVIGFIIVPLYLYYFLIESAHIKEKWSDYLPIRASEFKDEVVECLIEINDYLIAFFRGQLFVSVINGISTGIGLMVLGLDFGLLIGLMMCVLGLIPYLGNILCWVPAVIIAAVQGGSGWIPAEPWWVMPVAVSGVFVVVQQIDGFFITPRVVGEAVGLHPMTVIASMLVWGLLLGGLLGAILAVPLTASVKVLFQRYIWRARIAPQTVGGARLQGDE